MVPRSFIASYVFEPIFGNTELNISLNDRYSSIYLSKVLFLTRGNLHVRKYQFFTKTYLFLRLLCQSVDGGARAPSVQEPNCCPYRYLYLRYDSDLVSEQQPDIPDVFYVCHGYSLLAGGLFLECNNIWRYRHMHPSDLYAAI